MRQRAYSSEGQKDRFKKHMAPAPDRRRRQSNGPVITLSVDGKKRFNHTLNGLHEEYLAIEKQQKLLEKRKKEIKQLMRDKGYFKSDYFSKTFKIYVLELEGKNFYVGQTRNVKRRVARHQLGGSRWTKLYKPVSTLEVRETEALLESEAAAIEDEVTIEYAIKYCARRVRGGGYTQTSTEPRWPQEVLDSEAMCSHL